jgi:hypothetical protein
MKNIFYLLVVGILVCLAGTSYTAAQTVQGVVAGTVTDPSGGAVPDATVTLTNMETGIAQETKTDANGDFRFSLVPPGRYELRAKTGNFAEFAQSGIVLEASRTVSVPVKLQLATTTTAVEVTSNAPLVQSEDSQFGITVNNQTIEQAPLLSRNVFDLAFLAPSVNQGMNMNPASGGAREAGTSYLLNGADNNDNFSEGSRNITPPLESVQDFTVITNSYGAQYGRSAGAVVSTNQKAGTNQFHGVAYEFNRNRSLNAWDFFSKKDRENDPTVQKPKYIRNQFGGQIGGPIKRDKAFWSFAYDQIEIRTGSPLTTGSSPNVFVPSHDRECVSVSGAVSFEIPTNDGAGRNVR